MLSGKDLLDEAVKLCGSRYALAKRLKISQGQLSDIAAGAENLAPGLSARLAEIVGQEQRGPKPLKCDGCAVRRKSRHMRRPVHRSTDFVALPPAWCAVPSATARGFP